MNITITQEEINFALQSYMALKGYSCDGGISITVNYGHLTKVNFNDVRRASYNQESLLKLIKTRY